MRTIRNLVYVYEVIEDLKKTMERYESDGGRQISQDEFKISYGELYSVMKRLKEIQDEFLNLEI